MMKRLDENFIDSLLRGEAIVMASRIHDKQRIAQQLRERIESEKQNLFMQETIDDHLRQEYGPGVIRLDLIKIPVEFDFRPFEKLFWETFSGRPFGSEILQKPSDASAQAHEYRQQTNSLTPNLAMRRFKK
jgi:hypothetical protein